MTNPFLEITQKENPFTQIVEQKAAPSPPSEAESAILAEANLPSGLARVQQPGVQGLDISPESAASFGLTVGPIGASIGWLQRTGKLGEIIKTLFNRGLPAKAIEELRPITSNPFKTITQSAESIAKEVGQVGRVSAEAGAGGVDKTLKKILGRQPFEGEIAKPVPVTELTESEKLATSIVSPKTTSSLGKGPRFGKGEAEPLTNGLEKSDFDILKIEERPSTPSDFMKDKITTPLNKAARNIAHEFGSPYDRWNLGSHPKAMELWKTLDQADRAQAVWRNKNISEMKQNIKIKPQTDSSRNIGELLDRYQTYEEIPSHLQAQMTSDEKTSFKYMRSKWDEWGDMLVEKGLMEPTKKIKSYLFRIFDKETIYNAWKMELDQATARLAAGSIDAKLSAAMKGKIDKLQNSISTYEKTGTVLYDYIPESLRAPFLKDRKGAQGYSFDSVRAFTLYEKLLAKKIYDEPAIRAGVELMKQIPDYDTRNYARWFMRRYLEMEKVQRLPLETTLVNLEYLKDMGLNIRSAMTNATQHINTIVDIGPRATMEGAYRAIFDKEAEAIWKASGHAAEIPGLYYGSLMRGAEKANEAAFYLFNKVELGNRKTAYLGSYYDALRKGKTPELASQIADDVVRNTQFIYGRLGMPKFTSRPGGAIAGQFTTFSVKQTELLANWIKENPKKFIAYVLASGGMVEGSRQLGIDISNAIGIGVDHKELFDALQHLSKGEASASWIHVKLGIPRIPGTDIGRSGAGIAPSGVMPLINTVRQTLSGEWDKLIPVAVGRAQQSIKALMEGETVQGGYPIRTSEGTLSTRETLTQTLGRNIVKPYAETQSQIEMQREKLTDQLRRDKHKEAVRLVANGKGEEANKLLDKYGVVVTPEDMKAEYFRRNFTPVERARIHQWMNKREILMRYKIGEYPGEMP